MVVTGLLAGDNQHCVEHMYDGIHEGLSVRSCLPVPHRDISRIGECFLGMWSASSHLVCSSGVDIAHFHFLSM